MFKWGTCAKVFIRHQELPVCKTCVYFLAVTNNYPYDALPDNNLGRCKKFGELHCVTGVVEYDYAMRCRNDASKCGKLAVEYKPL